MSFCPVKTSKRGVAIVKRLLVSSHPLQTRQVTSVHSWHSTAHLRESHANPQLHLDVRLLGAGDVELKPGRWSGVSG